MSFRQLRAQTGLLEQTRISILSWNPGPRRGREGAHALQEATEYFQHQCFTNHFYITHFAGCAILFNTFHSDIQFNSVYIHSNRNGAASGHERRTVRMGTTSRHLPCLGPMDTAQWSILLYHDVAPHRQPIRNVGFAKTCFLTDRTVMFQEQVDMAPHGGASQAMGHRPSGTIEEAFCQHVLTCSAGPHTAVGDQVVYQANWVTHADLSSHRGSETEWHIRMHGAFQVPYDTLGIRRADQRLPSRSLGSPPPRQCAAG